MYESVRNGFLCAALVAGCTESIEEVNRTVRRTSALTADQCNYFAEGGKVQICHRTSSSKYPYTVIQVSEAACVDAHTAHEGDYVAVGDPSCMGLGCLPEAAPCDEMVPCCDGTCVNGACVTDMCAGVVCAALPCHEPGTCDPSTGVCSDPVWTADGAPCDDGDACTEADACQAGVCTGAADPIPCEGVCALADPECIDGQWVCSGPGFEPVEESCDGFDNDCDGLVDEDVCSICAVPMAAIQQKRYSIMDLDFDFECRSYLTSLISGPDFTIIVQPDGAAQKYFGNGNQNMQFALVDPDPASQRVVVTYSCCPSCGCVAKNGLTLLYSCSPADPDCGCSGQLNCPGFLDAPFLPTGKLDTSVPISPGYAVSTPTGLAAGPGNTYFAGNFRPEQCSTAPDCVRCDPANPGNWCTPGTNCCDTGTFGRLAQFTLPVPGTPGTPPNWRVVKVFDGHQIIGLASGRDGSVLVGTHLGHLYRVDPGTGAAALLHTLPGTVRSITQDRRNGSWYVEVDASPRVRRLLEDGTPTALPATVPASPPGLGVLQYGPDGRLYRLVGAVDASSSITSYDLPL